MTAQPSPPLLRLDGSPVRVLVVDDEQSLARELLSMALRYEGWDVRTATGGVAALRSAAEFRRTSSSWT